MATTPSGSDRPQRSRGGGDRPQRGRDGGGRDRADREDGELIEKLVGINRVA